VRTTLAERLDFDNILLPRIYHIPLFARRAKPMATATKPATKSEVLTKIADATELSRKQVASVFDALSEEIKGAVGKKGPGVFVVPGLLKLTVVTKPATKARKGINPFTKLEVIFKAKPARKVVKVRPLKALKDFAK
jgi:nucleoid DNA-binding protein